MLLPATGSRRGRRAATGAPSTAASLVGRSEGRSASECEGCAGKRDGQSDESTLRCMQLASGRNRMRARPGIGSHPGAGAGAGSPWDSCEPSLRRRSAMSREPSGVQRSTLRERETIFQESCEMGWSSIEAKSPTSGARRIRCRRCKSSSTCSSPAEQAAIERLQCRILHAVSHSCSLSSGGTAFTEYTVSRIRHPTRAFGPLDAVSVGQQRRLRE